MSILEEAGKRPYLSALVIIGGGAFLYFTLGGAGASSGSSVISSGPSDASVQAASAMSIAQLQADTQLSLSELDAEKTVTLAGLDAALQGHTVDASHDLGVRQINADDAKSARETTATEHMFSTQIAYDTVVDNNATARGINADTLNYNATISQQASDRAIAETNASATTSAAKTAGKASTTSAVIGVVGTIAALF